MSAELGGYEPRHLADLGRTPVGGDDDVRVELLDRTAAGVLDAAHPPVAVAEQGAEAGTHPDLVHRGSSARRASQGRNRACGMRA